MRKYVAEERKRSGVDVASGQTRILRLRSMLDDPQLTYEAIGERLGLCKQRIGQLAQKLAVDGRQREQQRILRRLTFSRRKGYSTDVLAAIRAIKRVGYEVLPYRKRSQNGLLEPTSKQNVLINGVLCRIYCRHHSRGTVCGGRYVQLLTGRRAKAVRAAIFAVWIRRRMRLYVVPARALVNVSSFMLPFTGRYSTHGKKPKRDWTAYENAWHFVNGITGAKRK